LVSLTLKDQHPASDNHNHFVIYGALVFPTAKSVCGMAKVPAHHTVWQQKNWSFYNFSYIRVLRVRPGAFPIPMARRITKNMAVNIEKNCSNTHNARILFGLMTGPEYNRQTQFVRSMLTLKFDL
jgi:hypothetical protein